MSEEYGEKYEKMIIVTMSAAIILSLAAVTWMIVHYTPDCKPSISTYCGEMDTSNPH
ncbi:hypothetical protein N9D31_04275 [Oligoflexaceae bacterium]|nr:hypothetical protein [Oligoflexaceae bacterium]